MKKIILATGLMSMTAKVMAQSPVDGSHYPAGLNGIKGGTLPGPGIYLRDDNWFYYGTGGGLLNYKTFEYLQAPQLMWIMDWTIIGANVGMDVELPIVYREASYQTGTLSTPNGGYSIATFLRDSQSGLGDIKLEPLLLSWHWKHFDTTVGYALWVPSGKSSGNSIANLGDDVWANMITLGGVWYPDEKKTWALSLLHHYEINSAQMGVATTTSPGGGYSTTTYPQIPCSVYTLEWAVSKTILANTDAGIFGYYQKQFTDGSTAVNPFINSEVAGIGPEISTVIPGWNLAVSLRYAYEFTAYDRPQGHMVNLTLAKKF